MAHVVIAAVPARFAAHDAALLVHKDPDVLQLVQVPNVPVPPDGVLDGQAGRRLTLPRQVNHVTLSERRRRAALAKDRIARCQRQERLARVEAKDGRVARGQRALVGVLGNTQQQ